MDENLTEGIQAKFLVDNQNVPTIDKSSNDQIDRRSSKIEFGKKDDKIGKEMEICVELNEIQLKIVDIINVKENNLTKKETADFSLLLINRVEFFFLKYRLGFPVGFPL